ncbi:MAG TPA: DUF1499 domain-containing protein [Stellaceae bacterium]|nr:DUF1499 domain-containing protein [Stellaceae bacterium]
MATVIAPHAGAGTRLARGLALLGLGVAIVALALLIAGPLGWRVGWWRYNAAFSILMPWAAYVGIAAMAVSVLALALGAQARARPALALAVLGLVVGGAAAYFPWQASEMRGKYPRMNDVTTDFQNPPSLAFSEPMREAEAGGSAAYGGAETEALQKKFYGDIAPATLAMSPAQAFDKVLATARKKGWTIVKADPVAGIVEAYDRSRWFGFADDIAIRVTASGEGSRVDIRSHSRQGRGDFGVNAARVRGFIAVLKGGA